MPIVAYHLLCINALYKQNQMDNMMIGVARPYKQKRSNFQKKVNFVDCSDSSDSDDD